MLGKLLFKKEAIGDGDIEFYFIIDLVFQIQFLFISINHLKGSLCIFAKNNKNKPSPFAPFIALGSVLTYLLFTRQKGVQNRTPLYGNVIHLNVCSIC